MKKYILFDNDGVLVETEPWYYEATKNVLKDLDVILHEDVYLKLMAEGTTAWTLAEVQGISEETIIQTRHKRNELYQHYIQTKDIAIKGAKEVIEALSVKYKMGIVTTSRRVDFELIHHKGEITKFMDFVLCEEDYPRAKPYPDPYLKGLELFKAIPDEAIVVEDSKRGLSAAVAAGIECVIVHNEFTQSHDFSDATHRIQTLDALFHLLER